MDILRSIDSKISMAYITQIFCRNLISRSWKRRENKIYVNKTDFTVSQKWYKINYDIYYWLKWDLVFRFTIVGWLD